MIAKWHIIREMTQDEARDIMRMGYNVFLTGEAGTGKTFVLNRYIHFLQSKNIPVAITAATGIAATHLDGVTLDSWSGLGMNDDIDERQLRELAGKPHLVRRIKATKVLVIDEISMIHGSRLDAVDRILRSIRRSDKPFGGIQIILSGDLFQLPPVSRERHAVDFVFHSRAWKDLDLRICYLTVPKRQNDPQLLRVLSDIRKNRVTPQTRALLSQAMIGADSPKRTVTKLYTHNVDVDRINEQHLEQIREEQQTYMMTAVGPEKLTEMMKRSCLAPEQLVLKKGALVMFVRNNFEKGYFNGTLGIIKGFDRNDEPVVKINDGKTITVTPAAWTIMENNKIIAQLTQIPLRLAWAITVHKSQGMTLDAAEIDLSKSFVEGMGYVALSRVRTLKKLVLLGLNETALRVNAEVSALDPHLVEASLNAQKEIASLGWWKRFMRRRQFLYWLTSPA